jgi:hypothetical protein
MTAAATVPVEDISGTLPVGKGGTAAVSLTGYVKGNGTAAMTASSTIAASDITSVSFGVNNRSAVGNALSVLNNTWHPIQTGTFSGTGMDIGATDRFAVRNTTDKTLSYLVVARVSIYFTTLIANTRIAAKLYKYNIGTAAWSSIDQTETISEVSTTVTGTANAKTLHIFDIVQLAPQEQVSVYLSYREFGGANSTMNTNFAYISARALI